MPATTRDGLQFARGHSKDHRPDLKQIVFSLTLSSDGAVPIHFKTYSGNRTDDTTHIETWSTVRGIAGRADFLYVADSKVCTEKQLNYIVRHGGRVVTLMPDTWGEAKQFKRELREAMKPKRLILRRPVPNKPGKLESFYCFSGKRYSAKAGHRIHWIYTNEKRKRDRQSREERLLRVERELAELMGKLNTRQLKTREQIENRLHSLLSKHGVLDLYRITINTVRESSVRQLTRGRPGKNTRYVTDHTTIFTLSWTRNRPALICERRTDGIFPILCTDDTLSAKDALVSYKYQPRLEKRFEQLKSVHQVAPTLFKKVERVQAMMFLFFIALIVQAVIERQVRNSMQSKDIDAIPIYPEHRLAYHPTTAKIFDQFQDISVCRLMEGRKLVSEFRDQLNSTQRSVLELLGISEHDYWRLIG